MRRGSFPKALIEDPCAYEVIKHDDGPIILLLRHYEHSRSDSNRKYHLAGYQIGEFQSSYRLAPVHWLQWHHTGSGRRMHSCARVDNREDISVDIHSAIGNKITLGMLSLLNNQIESEQSKLEELKKEIYELEQSVNLVCDVISRIESRIDFLNGRRAPGETV